jgi:stress-induced morphogen
MPITHDNLLEVLQTAYPQAQIAARDTAGDQDHWLIEISDENLNKKSRIVAHREILAALAGRNIHAVEIKLKK